MSTGFLWSLLGIAVGAFLTFIINLLTHRVNVSQDRASSQAERLVVQVEETRYTVLTLTRDIATTQALLTELNKAINQHQARLTALEEKVGLFWHSVEEQLTEILRTRYRREDGT